VLLLSLAGMILPLVAFPARFGFELARPLLVNLLYEMVFYGLVVFIFYRRVTLLQLVSGAGICLVYRLTIGTVFGLFIAAMYSMDLGVSLRLGLSGYLPAILFHVAITPFVLKPIIGQLLPSAQAAPRQVPMRSEPNQPTDSGLSSVAVSKEHGVVTKSVSQTPEPLETEKSIEPTSPPPEPFKAYETSSTSPESVKAPSDQSTSGFEKAVYYIGEHASVHLAAVVDEEGLLLGNFTRNQIDPEAWAPLALLFLQSGGDVLERTELDGLERLDLQLKEKRMVVARSNGCSLMVVSERLDDDLLNIRINQGLDMINRFVAERYGDKLNSNAENIHVSSAQ